MVSHLPDSCKVTDPEARQKFLKEAGRCFLCLRKGHIVGIALGRVQGVAIVVVTTRRVFALSHNDKVMRVLGRISIPRVKGH